MFKCLTDTVPQVHSLFSFVARSYQSRHGSPEERKHVQHTQRMRGGRHYFRVLLQTSYHNLIDTVHCGCNIYVLH